MKGLIQSLYSYRGFIASSVKRDFQSRYQTSMLGVVWLILQPLAMILVYTLVFSEVMKIRLPDSGGAFSYSIYLCSGVLTWGLFSELVSSLQNVFVNNANLLKKISFPKICLPAISISVAIINFAIIFGLFFLFLLFSGNFPWGQVWALLPLLFIQVLFATGLGMTVGVINVFFRDVGQFVTILLQFWFWFTPIVYVMTSLPDWAQELLNLNPMTRIVDGYHKIFVYNTIPNWSELFPVLLLGIIMVYFGWKLYLNNQADIVDEL
ncbi:MULTISPECIES: ABC transporter permease [Vibrio]|uniref:ABC transporter permease n=1 Tax=Vibrio TaxID=662 RepID=UPI0010538E98|nr:ABC transporter permease [Vibrio crassostreae]TCW16982.1 lipopolysaccharide transport system permease protein [Vibrio crassostreae]CAK3664280.1 Transport permease protein [Vibrio crassostreae]